jgi:hypothetical protein
METIELGQVAEIEDMTPLYNYHLSLGNNPSKAKFKALFNTVYGSDTPPKSIKFIVKDIDGKVLFCLYNKQENEVYFEKLTKRSFD